MKIITIKDIFELNLDKSAFFDWVKEAMLEKKSAVLPPKTSMKWYEGEGFVNVMPTILPNERVYGVKVVSRNPNAIPTLKSNIMLFDLTSSNLISVMDADYITAYRTGACASLAIETLAVKDYSTIGLIGLGNICRATVNVLLSVVKNRKILFKLYLYNGEDNGLISILNKFKNVEVKTCKSIKETIVDSDVVISCVTFAGNDLAKPEWFKKGSLLVPVHTRGFMNCDEAFDRIIVDDYDHVSGFKNYDKFKNKHELTEVLLNPSCGRKNNEERIIAYNVGIGLLDIFFAKKIYDCCNDKKEFSYLEEELPLYWVS